MSRRAETKKIMNESSFRFCVRAEKISITTFKDDKWYRTENELGVSPHSLYAGDVNIQKLCPSQRVGHGAQAIQTCLYFLSRNIETIIFGLCYQS